MVPKRHIGLGKSSAPKKKKSPKTSQKTYNHSERLVEAKLTVELGEEIQVNDTLAQLRALWQDFINTADRNELRVNGVVHECDRILRKAHARIVKNAATNNTEAADKYINTSLGGYKKQMEDSTIASNDMNDTEEIELTGEFYGIYGLALSSLAFFYTEEPDKVQGFFTEAQERINVGKKKFPDSISLLFAEARVLINKILLIFIHPLTTESKVSNEHPDVASILDVCLQVWEQAVEFSEKNAAYKYYNLENSDFLQALDDLLDMVDNFGKETQGERDSDDEDAIEKEFVLGSKHPLFVIGETNKYNLWWREHTQRFLKNLNEKVRIDTINECCKSNTNVSLLKELSKRLGQSYLLEAEEPSSVFTTLTYYDKERSSLNSLTSEDARSIGKDLLSRALDYLKVAQDEEEPDSWAAVAEAMISLGNMYDLDSDEQQTMYKEAEEILIRANNATNGRYEKILENLTQI